MAVRPFPIVEVEGEARDCGYGHGRQAAERVARSLEIYRPAFEQRAGLSWPEVRERAREYAGAIEQLSPEIMAEIRGIAAGSGHPVEDIVALNCRTEILYSQRTPPPPAAAAECTTIVALPEATATGGALVGKNWDWRAPCVDSLVILKVRQRGMPAFSMLVEAGMVGRDGFNEAGIVECGNLLVSHEDRGQVGVPIPVLRRRILQSTRFYQAVEAVILSTRGASSNYILAHRDGVAIDFETSPEHYFPVYPERGLLTHTNHFQSPVAWNTGVAKPYTADTLYRDFRARQLLEPKIGSIAVADIQAVLRDHFGHPRSICRHEDPDYPQPTATIASLVFDLGAGLMHVAAGNPCQADYQPVGLPGQKG